MGKSMNKDIADKWVEALRSGKYKQGRGLLKGEVGFCCLGVLCDISNLSTSERDDMNLNTYCGKVNTLPSTVMKWAGININRTTYRLDSLARLNDEGESFDEIANLIERTWENL